MGSKDYMEEYCLWMSSDAFDEKTKKELVNSISKGSSTSQENLC